MLALNVFLSCLPLSASLAWAEDNLLQNVLLYSDAGFGNDIQARVATGMYAHHQVEPFSFAISAGDNIQASGYTKNTLHELFAIPYANLIESGLRFYAVPGNHDHFPLRLEAELKYAKNIDAVNKNTGGFVMPSPDYVVTKEGVNIVFLDVLTGVGGPNWNKKREQFATREICNRTQPWLIVVAHAPVWSTGELHGDNREWQEHLLPILRRCPADFVISGHDHHAELFIENDTRFAIVGNAGNPRAGIKASEKKSVFRSNVPGFAALELQKNTATLRFFDEKNVELYSDTAAKQ